jgi:polyphenol oxidase
MSISIEQPHIFPMQHILSGVTERNAEALPPNGFSALKTATTTEEEAERNRTALAEQLGFPRSAFVFQQQVHGARVRAVALHDSSGTSSAPFEESDALTTNLPNVILCVGIADCAAVLLYDATHGAVAAVHSGWRGTAANLARRTVERMSMLYGTEAASLLAYISPCASGKRYIVRDDVAQYFPFTSALKKINSQEYTFDNRVQITMQLRECGVRALNIEVAHGCTISETRYHSHRRDGLDAGRMIAFIGVRDV